MPSKVITFSVYKVTAAEVVWSGAMSFQVEPPSSHDSASIDSVSASSALSPSEASSASSQETQPPRPRKKHRLASLSEDLPSALPLNMVACQNLDLEPEALINTALPRFPPAFSASLPVPSTILYGALKRSPATRKSVVQSTSCPPGENSSWKPSLEELAPTLDK
jgi:hypothetical protein